MEFPVPPPPPARPFWDRPGATLGVAGLLLYIVMLAHFMDLSAAGSDTSGYLNHARLLVAGHLHVPMRTLPGLPRAGEPYDFYTPLGLKPAPDGNGLVPTYPAGLPLMILAATRLVGGNLGGGLVVVAHALLGLFLTYALGRTLGLGVRWAALGAVALVVSPLYWLYSVQVMSDVPATGWVVAAVLAAWRAGEASAPPRTASLWALGSGAALALAVLIRPNSIIALAPVALALGWSPRRWTMLVLGSLPGAVVFSLHARAAYGTFITTGYGDNRYLFSTSFIAPTLAHYARWLPVLFTPAALLFPGLPWLKKVAPRTATVLGAWILAYLAFYACYRTTHETWWYLRFLLPAAPALIVGGLLVARQGCPFAWSPAAYGMLLVLVLANGAFWTRNFGVLNISAHDRTYPVAMDWMRAHVPADAVVAAWQTSGALFYYTPFTFFRWELINARGFRRVVAAAGAAHRPIYAALFKNERAAALGQHMPGAWTSLESVGDITIWKWEGGK